MGRSTLSPTKILNRYRRVLQLAVRDRRELAGMSHRSFRSAWSAVCFVFPGLHPDDALDHGRRIRVSRAEDCPLADLLPTVARYFEKSGWPVALAAAAGEAWSRYRSGRLREHEFYDAASANEALFGEAAGLELPAKSPQYDAGERLS